MRERALAATMVPSYSQTRQRALQRTSDRPPSPTAAVSCQKPVNSSMPIAHELASSGAWMPLISIFVRKQIEFEARSSGFSSAPGARATQPSSTSSSV